MTFEDLPLLTQAAATRMLREAERNVMACGDSGVAEGYWVESHTLGCRDEGGDADLWAAHWEFWDKYSKDGISVLIGDPTTGAFVSITPQKDTKVSMGAEMLIELGRRVKKTVPLAKGDKIAAKVERYLKPKADTVIVAGSVRRRRPQIGDVEFVVLPRNVKAFINIIERDGWTGGDRIRKKMDSGIPVELYIAHKPEELGAMLFTYTGDFQHNIAMRSIAKREGWKLDQYGIWDAKTGEPLLQSPDEREFYDFLGVDYHTPEERSFTNRSKSKKSTMGAEMLIELGAIERNVGYIELKLVSPEEDFSGNWVLLVTRADPYGGAPWMGEFPFQNEEDAKSWFKMIQGDEDVDHLISIFARR